MDLKRRCEVLEALLNKVLRDRKVPIVARNEFKRELKNLAKETGIQETELRAVLDPIIKNMADDMLALEEVFKTPVG